jgi:phage terminase Nu1 subunit (DNA packaging protein)
VDLDQPCTQKDFALLVGVTQPAVSDLLTRGILKAKEPARTWLQAYTKHLREAAAGRGADGELAQNRAAESATRNEMLQIKLKKMRGEYGDVSVISQVLAYLGASIASKLEPLPARIKMLCPQLTAEDLKEIEGTITELRNRAASASIDMLKEANKDDDEGMEEVVRASD